MRSGSLNQYHPHTFALLSPPPPQDVVWTGQGNHPDTLTVGA